MQKEDKKLADGKIIKDEYQPVNVASSSSTRDKR